MRGINILMYHQVAPFPELSGAMHAHRSTYCRVERFAAQMAWLSTMGYSVLSMDQVFACVTGKAVIPPRAVALTFDDGYDSFAEHAWPILRQHGFPAMVYLIAGLLGQPSRWFAADGRPTPPLLAAERVRELRREGCDFGGHTVHHLKLAQLEPAAIRTEVRDCKTRLEEVLGERVEHFCYPFGSHDGRVVEAVANAGYRCATTCVRAPAQAGMSPLRLPRKAISYGDSLPGFIWKLHMKNRPRQGMPDLYGRADAPADYDP
jgi:peptidoglycan/xylan/chitin deacetylase (PgdA/CDA1 family)